MKRICRGMLWVGIVVLGLAAFPAAGCDGGERVGFGIFLVDTGELVLSDRHIEAYYRDTHEIELNEEGIEKWNSYHTYQVLPTLDGLFAEDFFVAVEGTEVYRGKFYSYASSVYPPGIIIVDTLFRLDSDNNKITVALGFPWPAGQEDPRNSPAVIDYLEERGLLR